MKPVKKAKGSHYPKCFDFFIKDSEIYETVQPLEEFHIGTGVIQPPVIEIGGLQATRHPATKYKSFKRN